MLLTIFTAIILGCTRKTPARLEAAGLGALAWIEEQLSRLPEGHSASADLKAMAARFANSVSEISFDAGNWDAPASLRSQIAALKGQPLTSEAVINLLLKAIESLPDRKGSVVLIADRLGDGTGVGLQLRTIPGNDDAGTSVDADLKVVADGKSLEGSHGSGTRDYYARLDSYQHVAKGINKALTLPNNKTFEIRLELNFR
jgi:hypothetical protein